MSNETQHTPADVRGRIIRASILHIEDEETMIAGLRAGAEAVERGELDAEDFAGIWSQYLRELFRRASSVPAPADVRERAVRLLGLAMERAEWLCRDVGRAEWPLSDFNRDMLQERLDTVRDLIGDALAALLRTPRGEGERVQGAWATVEAAARAQANVLDSHYGGQPSRAAEIRNAVEQVAALLRTPRGEGEAWPGDAENDASFLRSWARYLRTEAQDIREAQDRADWKQQAEYTEVAAARMDQIANRIAALRSGAQGQDRLEDLVFLPIVEAYNEAHAARRGEGGGDGD